MVSGTYSYADMSYFMSWDTFWALFACLANDMDWIPNSLVLNMDIRAFKPCIFIIIFLS